MTSQDPHAVPKLIDFGCADVKETTTLLNRVNTQTLSTLAGFTPKYVAPEVIKTLSRNSSTTVTTLSNLVTEALDIYAFGVWMSEVLHAPATAKHVFQLPSPAEGELTYPLLSALQTTKATLEELVNKCLSKTPSKRPTAQEIVAKLSQIESQLQETSVVKHVEEHEIIECSVCCCEVKRKDTAICKVPLGNGHSQEMHVYCRECLKVMLEDWRSKAIAKHVEAKGKITCSYGACSGRLDEQAVLAVLPEALEVITHVQKSTAEFVAIEKVKHQFENESLEQRAIRHVDENILAVRCPKCKAVAAINFDECLALTCPGCKTNFCGYCMVDCGDDAHDHVSFTHPTNRGLGLFTTQERWYHYFYNQQLPKLNEYLSTLPGEVAVNVRQRFPSL